MYKYIHTCICVYIHTCMCVHIYMFAYIHTYTYIYTHTKYTYKHTQARLERQRGRERARSCCRPRKLCTSLLFDAIKPHFAPPMQKLHCTHVLKHQYPSSGAAEPQYASTQESKPENCQSDCSREMKGQWRTTNPRKQPITQIKTVRRPDNTRSSALVWIQSTKFMVNPCRELQSPYSDIGSHFHHFPAVFRPWDLWDFNA